jgi:hypothetical protein
MGIVPPYWNVVNGTTVALSHDFPRETTTAQWGPCFGAHKAVQWDLEIESRVDYPKPAVGISNNDWANYCRPGFLIIGAGKCGTSVCGNLLRRFDFLPQNANFCFVFTSHCIIISRIIQECYQHL